MKNWYVVGFEIPGGFIEVDHLPCGDNADNQAFSLKEARLHIAYHYSDLGNAKIYKLVPLKPRRKKK